MNLKLLEAFETKKRQLVALANSRINSGQHVFGTDQKTGRRQPIVTIRYTGLGLECFNPQYRCFFVEPRSLEGDERIPLHILAEQTGGRLTA